MSLGTLLPNSYQRPRRSISDIIRWGFGRRLRFLVHGQSMSPTLTPGLSVLVSKTRQPMTGDIVVATHPDNNELVVIKRCIKKTAQGLWLEGDNLAQSTDSRHLGWFSTTHCIGVVTSIV